MDVILSIKPKYSDAILSGEKKFEFRRKIFKRCDVKRIFIYKSNGVGAIVGSFVVEGLLSGTPEHIWSICGEYGAISEAEFFEYFRGTQKAYAIKIGKYERFPEPIDPSKLVQGFRAPQNFRYLARCGDYEQLPF
jgi:predicted transcriptional regulator